MEHKYYRIQQIYKSYPRFHIIIDKLRNPSKNIKKCFVLIDLLEFSKYTDKIEFHKDEKHYFQTILTDGEEYITNIYYDDSYVNLIIIYEDNTITIAKELGYYYKDYKEKPLLKEEDFPEEVWKQIKEIKIDLKNG